VLKQLGNIFKVEELRKKVLITFALILVYRAGCFIPTPGIDIQALSRFFEQVAKTQGQTLLGVMNLFTGGALRRLSIFSLGIMPYISASIIMQLLTAVVPALERLAKEGKGGYEKINQYTRYLTLVICVIQGSFLAKWLQTGDFRGETIVPNPGFMFYFITVATLACGTVFVMWLGEQIQERGIGNGISIIITAGILSRMPISLYQLYLLWSPLDPAKSQIDTVTVLALLAVWLAVIVAVVLFTQAQRRIPIQYARRVVGRKVYGGQSTFLPIRVDMAGVIAIIFSQSVILFPATIAGFLPKFSRWTIFLQKVFGERGLWYNLIFAGLILFFMYFYTAIVFNPIEIANNLKKYGGFVPGIRPGRNTAEHLDYVATRIVFVGAIYIAMIAVLPTLIIKLFRIPSYDIASFFGGTTVLIMVGVVLDTMRQIEGQLLLRHYDGFMKKGKMRGRR